VHVSRFCKGVMQNVDLPELLGPAIIQVKGYLNLSHSYMTDVFPLPSLFISIEKKAFFQDWSADR